MPNVESSEPDSNVDILLKALRAAETPDEIRRYARVLAREIETQLVGASDIASGLVDALTEGK
jgi:hypothetical protein